MLLIFVVIKFNGSIQSVINTIQLNMYRREQGGLAVNLIPFNTIGSYISNISYVVSIQNILGNIIPFVPMGFLMPMGFPSQRNIIKTMISCFFLICGIEVLQLVCYLGSFDIDDIILNLLSCFIGFMLFIAYKNKLKVAYLMR